MTTIRVYLPNGDAVHGDEITLHTDADGMLYVYNGYHSYPIPPGGSTLVAVLSP